MRPLAQTQIRRVGKIIGSDLPVSDVVRPEGVPSKITTGVESRLIPEGAEVVLPGGYQATLVTRSNDRAGSQGIYLVKQNSAAYIYKVYGNRCNPIRQWSNRLGALLEGRSKPDAETRLRIERQTLALWRQHGFPVFREAPSAPHIEFDAPYLRMEYVPGASATQYFADPAVERKAKFETLGRLIMEWGKRHELARSLHEPSLVHEHPSLGHLWRGEDGIFYTFDFEVVFTRAYRTDHLIAREIFRLTRSVITTVPAEERGDYLDFILKHYPFPEFFKIAYTTLCASPNPFVRAFRFLERHAPRNRRPFSRFQVARWIHERLCRLQRI